MPESNVIFKVGDRVRFDNCNPKNKNKTLYGKDRVYTISRVKPTSLGIDLIYIKEEPSLEYYSWRFYLDDGSPSNSIISKIKYLDQKFKDRKHVKI